MDAHQQIEVFKEFLEQFYYSDLLEIFRKKQTFIILDFAKLKIFSPEISEILLEQPEEIIAAAEHAVREKGENIGDDFFVRFQNLPDSQKMLIRNIRSKHIRKMYWFRGVVRNKSDVRPEVSEMRFECPACGNIIHILQLENKLREPSMCSCGRKGKFKVLSKKLIDAQALILEEASEDLSGSEQPKRLNILVKNDLVSPINEKKAAPGTKIDVIGWAIEVPKELRSGAQSVKFDLVIDANNIVPCQEDFDDLKISPEEEKEIDKISKDPFVYEKLVKNVAPSIYGHNEIKESLIIQLVGGVRKQRPDGIVTRGDIHVMLMGDPGCGKSQLLKRIYGVAPKARYVTGKGASGAGLTAAVVKDEFLGGWSLEAGALVLANKGFVMIDELDKMDKEDQSAMHEGMEQQTVSISKANIQATLKCETTILAAANPKFGRFDAYEPVIKQVNLPPTLVNRFDLIFVIKDLPDEEKDTRLAQFILERHQNPELAEADIPTDLFRKFISRVRQEKPTLGPQALEELRDYYVRMRSMGRGEDGQVKNIPITARQLEALIRMAESSAKIRKSTFVEREDSQRAIRLLEFCLSQVAKDSETGKIDIDVLSSGTSGSQRGRINIVKEIIIGMTKEGHKDIEIKEIVKIAEAKGLNEDEVSDVLEKLKRSGDIYEPKNGVIQKL